MLKGLFIALLADPMYYSLCCSFINSEQKYKTEKLPVYPCKQEIHHIMDMRPIPGTLPSRLPADCHICIYLPIPLSEVTYLSPSTSYTHPMIPTETKLFVVKME